MKICDRLQERLAEAGIAAVLEDAELERHLETCADCTAFLEDLARVEAALGDLPSPDAPDSLVADTLHAVRRAGQPDERPGRPGAGRRRLAGALAASVVILATIGLAPSLLEYQLLRSRSVAVQEAEAPTPQSPVLKSLPKPSESVDRGASSTSEVVVRQFEKAGEEAAEVARQPKQDSGLQALTRLEGFGEAEPEETLGAEAAEAKERSHREADIIAQLEDERQVVGLLDALRGGEGTESQRRSDTTEEAGARLGGKSKPEGRYRQDVQEGSELSNLTDLQPNQESLPESLPAPKNEVLPTRPADPKKTVQQNQAPSSRDELRELRKLPEAGRDKDNRETLAVGSLGDDAGVGGAGMSSLSREQFAQRPVGGGFTYDDGLLQGPASLDDPARARLRARAFLAAYDSREGLVFQDPSGYWANTYIPGDPAMRLLQARLQAWDRRPLGREASLERSVRPVSQVIDAPQQAALALHLQADKSGLHGPTRLRLQVGIKGAERQGGQRPAMNVGLVVDLRDLAGAQLGALRALITALERARQPDDRFSLTVAGPDGGLLVPPEQFRHGPLRVALQRLFGGAPVSDGKAVGLPEAIALAAQSVRAGDRPEAILGSSLLVLVTGASLAGDLPALEAMAHENAIAGVPLSVVDLGVGSDPEQIDRLVAAGQGNRRVLRAAGEVEGLIDRELHAASRAVARALRLRIRLAPGVKLIDVLGSRPLGELQAARVRQAEKAIDRRLARNYGIRADRGADEEGIQIVIPTFYAGDAHVILLDVVAEGPGPVADVTLRYKDVAYLRNGVASASLSLAGGRDLRGPLERNVLKNLVAWDLSRRAAAMSRLLEQGDMRQAAAALAALRELINGLRLEVAGWSSDPDLAADEALLDDYLAMVRSPAAQDSVQRRYLAQSLRYAAFRKLQSAAP